MDKKLNPSVADILYDAGKGPVAENLDRVFTQMPIGQVSSAIGNSFYGINHRQQPGLVPINKDYYGLTFFTRPRMNLRSENIRAVRQLTPLLTNEPASIQRIIRCLLDPTLAKGNSRYGEQAITTPFVDEKQAFIPMLTNHLLSCNGWPDLSAPMHTAPEGVYKETWHMVDGVVDFFSSFSLTANFRNLPGDPINAMFLVWLFYMSRVMEGSMVPYPDSIVLNEIDYNTRIYRLVLDSSKRFVTKIAACGAAIPSNVPIGASFNFESDRPINASNDQISITFNCVGAMYQDDILVKEFNRTVELFNDQMDPLKFYPQYRRVQSGANQGELVVTWKHVNYVQVPLEALAIFNNRGYPRIDPVTYELQWWISQQDYNMLLPLYQESQRNKETK